ncbi:MAG: ABC transporter substrate-binding protein, partial [Verrucomicrobiota bacterium]
MKRRDFITKTATGVAAGGVLAGCVKREGEAGDGAGPNVVTKKHIKWNLASSYPPALDTIYGAAVTMADRVKDMTDGGFEIKVHAAGELVPGLEVLDAVQSGSVEIGHSASYYYIGKNDALVFDTTLPFGLTARQQNAWLYEGGGLDLLRGVFADFNVYNYPGGNTGVQMGGWFRKEINNVDDLGALTMRIPGMGGKVME